ncbi:MAG: hypothetical protein M3Z19_02095 [Chloroflexota bacterium]|nr:hypothetical protein [Chloroflexota bacterium]
MDAGLLAFALVFALLALPMGFFALATSEQTTIALPSARTERASLALVTLCFIAPSSSRSCAPSSFNRWEFEPQKHWGRKASLRVGDMAHMTLLNVAARFLLYATRRRCHLSTGSNKKERRRR